ncbi:MAG: tRNA(Ile)-lysidine synthetase [Anaerolineae bacterium]
MKCRKCGQTAAINMPQHKLALCAECFQEWIPAQTQRFIEKYRMFDREDRVLVAVSGGKDSLALWDVLLRLEYQAEGLYIGLGIEGGNYSEQSLTKAQNFAASREGARLTVVDVRESYGESIPELARQKERGRGKPCSLCGLVKRHVMNRVAVEGGYTVLATGHNLDDEAAVLFQNTLHWQTGYLARQAPVLPSTQPGLARKVKPFCRFYERETAAYALVRGIDYIYDECPHAVGSSTIYYKHLLNQLEGRSRGAKLQFYLSFLQAKEQGLFDHIAQEVELHPCEKCGQPTTAPGLCAFCRLWEPRAELAEG